MGSSFLPTTKARKESSSTLTRTRRWHFIGSNSTDRFASAGKQKEPRVKNRKPIFIRVLWAVSLAPGRRVLDARMAEMTERFGAKPIPLPPQWGGYRVKPDTIEFWQGRPNRLHDRFRYACQADGSWLIERLAP